MNFLGPQVDVAVGMNEACSNPNQSWQGLTIKEILEKVDLSNIIMDEDKKKVIGGLIQSSVPGLFVHTNTIEEFEAVFF